MSRIVFLGHVGTDGPTWYIGADGKIHKIPGWNPEQLHDLQHAVQALRSVSQIKSAGLAERLGAALHEAISKELGAHLEKGDVIVVG